MNGKRIISILSCVLIAAVSIILISCSRASLGGALSAPQNLRVEGGALVWDEVKHATGYAVYIENTGYETKKARFDLSALTERNRVYELYVIALGDGHKYSDSEEVKFDYTYTPHEVVGTPNLSYKLLADRKGYEVSRGTANLEGKIIIPDYYNGLPVKRIAKEGFWKEIDFQNPATGQGCNTKTTGIRLPETLEVIGELAFTHCIVLTEIEIPDSVSEIGQSAFYSCIRLERVKLPSNLYELPGYTFFNCRKLKEMDLPDTLKKIGSHALAKNFILPYINVPDGITEIGEHAFSECNAITEITIPNSVTRLEDGLLSSCISLADIRFPDKIEYFGSTVVWDTKWLKNQPEGIVTVQGYMCGYNGEVSDGAEIVIPSSVKEITGHTFSDVNAGSVTVIVPDGVKIGAQAFMFFRGLKSIRLPSDITIIPDRAFYFCHALESIEIPAGVTEIGESAFLQCKALTSIELPSHLRIIGRGAFDICENLKLLRIPESTIEVGSLADSRILEIIISQELVASGIRLPLNGDRKIYITCSPSECEYDFEEIYGNKRLTFYLYVENEEDLPDDGGNYWHYAEDGKTPVAW